MKYELIMFEKDKYGVRRKRWWGGYQYLDLVASAVSYWWSVNSSYFRCCLASKKIAEDAFNNENRLNRNKVNILKRRTI